MKRISAIIIAFVVLLGGLLSSTGVFAASDHTMTVSPPSQKIVLTPGEEFEGTILVSNSTDATRDLIYSVTVGSFSLREDESGKADYDNVDVETITSYNQIMNWIILGKTEGTVGANEVDTVPFIIKVPKDAPAGGQYATIVIQDDTKKDEEDDGNVTVQSVFRFAANIFAEVTGKTRDEGSIPENDIPAFSLDNTLNASSTVHNSGNVHTDAQYILQVWPLFSDEEICTNEEEPSTSFIMPGTEKYHVESCTLPAIGIFKAKQIVKIFNETSIFERMVIVCPLWLLFLIVFGITALIIYYIARVKARKNERRSAE